VNEADRLEQLAGDYDPTSDFDRHILSYFAERIATGIEGKAVLELGCSGGQTAIHLARVAASLDLVDGSAAYIELARSRVQGAHVRFYHALFETFEPDRQYDTIVCSHVMEHVENPVAILRRISRWLKAAGSVFVYVPNALSIHRRLGVEMGLAPTVYELSKRDHMIGHRRVYDAQTLSKDIEAAGFRHGALGGVLIKPFPNAVMSDFADNVIEGLLRLGETLPEISSDIYFECKNAIPETRDSGLDR